MSIYFILMCMLITSCNAQTSKKSTDQNTSMGFLSLAKSLLMDFINDNSDFGHMLLSHAEKCPFYCLNDATPKPDPDFEIIPNGCGAYNVELNFANLNMPNITDCCNAHDTCYSTCNSKKPVCDRQFKFCLNQYCSSLENTGLTDMHNCNSRLLYFILWQINLIVSLFL